MKFKILLAFFLGLGLSLTSVSAQRLSKPTIINLLKTGTWVLTSEDTADHTRYIGSVDGVNKGSYLVYASPKGAGVNKFVKTEWTKVQGGWHIRVQYLDLPRKMSAFQIEGYKTDLTQLVTAALKDSSISHAWKVLNGDLPCEEGTKLFLDQHLSDYGLSLGQLIDYMNGSHTITTQIAEGFPGNWIDITVTQADLQAGIIRGAFEDNAYGQKLSYDLTITVPK